MEAILKRKSKAGSRRKRSHTPRSNLLKLSARMTPVSVTHTFQLKPKLKSAKVPQPSKTKKKKMEIF